MIVFLIIINQKYYKINEGVCNYSYFNNAFNRHDNVFVLKNIDTK